MPEENRLDLDIEPFLQAATSALRRRSGLPTAALLSDAPQTVEVGIADTFAVGRHDPDAFLLLAALFQRLPHECQPLALQALAMATHNPDIPWSRSNWIPSSVKSVVRARCRWTGDDVQALLAMIDDNGIGRGTIGQAVFHVLELDKRIGNRLFETATNRGRPALVRFWASAILLYLAGEDAPDLLGRLVRLAPDLSKVDHFYQLKVAIHDYGYVSLF